MRMLESDHQVALGGPPEKTFFAASTRLLIARLPSRIIVVGVRYRVARTEFFASRGVSVAYRVDRSAHAAPHARCRRRARQRRGICALCCICRGPVRHVLQRSPETAPGTAAGEFLRRSVPAKSDACAVV